MSHYDDQAAALSEQYNALNSESVHQAWLAELPQKPGLACDIGAGSGRDANWLAQQGWDVVAVEPSAAMRDLAQSSSHPRVTWLDDTLPALNKLRVLGHRFNLILLSAVWMHLPVCDRERAFRVLTDLLAPSGVLVITLRHGADEQENRKRSFYPVSSAELETFAKRRAVAVVHRSEAADMQRPHVKWETLVFKLPDDGTGSLPLLRHIIVNDNKAASYKLGLLRVLTRIAESAPGIVTARTEEYVDIPFGMVGLYWIKQYKPLVLTHKIRQTPGRGGYGFAKDAFYQLDQVSNYDLRVGASFSGGRAAIVQSAIKDACTNIKKMPAHYITYPGQNRSIFDCGTGGRLPKHSEITLSKQYLELFGTFRIPSALWQTFGQYACWLELAILREWSHLLSSWGVTDYRAIDMSVFDWEEGQRDTRLAILRVNQLREQGHKVPCVWSAKNPRQTDIDHCFPWSRWLNNDLWNLMPSSSEVNRSKGDKLPSAETFSASKDRIIHWWQHAYLNTLLERRFLMEAGTSLPKLVAGEPNLEDIYLAMLHQRARLKADQQLAEWTV